MTILQLIGLIVVIALTGIVITIGYYLIIILKKIDTTLTKVNKIINNINNATQSIFHPITTVSGFINGFKEGSKIIENLSPQKTDRND